MWQIFIWNICVHCSALIYCYWYWVLSVKISIYLVQVSPNRHVGKVRSSYCNKTRLQIVQILRTRHHIIKVMRDLVMEHACALSITFNVDLDLWTGSIGTFSLILHESINCNCQPLIVLIIIDHGKVLSLLLIIRLHSYVCMS